MLIKPLYTAFIFFLSTIPVMALCESPWENHPSTPINVDGSTYLPTASKSWAKQTAPSPTQFSPIKVEQTIDGQSHTLIYCAGNDYLKMGDPAFIYLSPDVETTQYLGNRWNIVPPTPKMVDQIHDVATKYTPSPRQPSPTMTQYIEGQAHFETINPTDNTPLISGHKKDIVLDPNIPSNGKIAIYGWIKKDKTPIQPLSYHHAHTYGDYSHGLRPILRTVILNGKEVDIKDVLNHPKLYKLISKQKATFSF